MIWMHLMKAFSNVKGEANLMTLVSLHGQFRLLINVLFLQVKAYTTRVGSGPFPTEILGQGGDLLRFAGQEFGTTTGRPRRCGWLDIVALKYCCQINGFSSLNLTKLDVLSDLPEIQLGVAYKHADGTPIKSFPADLRLLEQLKASLTLNLQVFMCSIHLRCPLPYIALEALIG